MKKTIGVILFIALATIVIIGASPHTQAYTTQDNGDPQSPLFAVGDYQDVLDTWKQEGYTDDIEATYVVSASDFNFDPEHGQLTDSNESYHHFLDENQLTNLGDAFVFSFSETADSQSYVDIVFDIEQAGLYKIGMDYYSQTTSIRPIEISVSVNDETPYYEASQIILNTFWETPSEFNRDRYGHEIMPNATQVPMWAHADLKDAPRLYEQGLLFLFQAGSNVVRFNYKTGNFLLGQVYIQNFEIYQSYADYQQQYADAPVIQDAFYEVQAEAMTLKNNVSVRYGIDRNPATYPFSLIENRLNIVDGDTFKTSGNAVYYDIEVAQSGWYEITLKTKQTKTHSRVFRTVTIDGHVPFSEAQRVVFDYHSNWRNYTLTGEDGETFMFYLEAGVRRIGLEANSAPMRIIYQNINAVMQGVNEIALDIRKLTGNNVDENRDWDIIDYMPNLEADLLGYAALMQESLELWYEVNDTRQQSEISAGLSAVVSWLEMLASDPDAVPRRINRLIGSSSSVLQRLGMILPMVIEMPLTYDVLYVHDEGRTLPRASAGFFENLWIGIQRFFASFFSNQYSASNDPEELQIWVNRGRQYVDLMQQMADNEFTTQTGIAVNISITPNEDKLILAASSGTQPDLAMGVAGWRPYDFAIRDAVVDLRTFDNFNEVAQRFEPGAFLQLAYQEGIYGLPETQNYSVLFYRSDIFNNLNLDVPDTWFDVVDLLPELQRYGMNFYSMLSSSSAFKSFSTTMPYITQFGADPYTEGALAAALDQQAMVDAMTFMTDLFTVYSLPLEVGSFYNQFRYGNIPIGVGDFGMYVQLLHAAPEIAGLWNVAPLPGIENDQGEVVRYYDGAATSAMMFKNSDKQQEAWEFLEWWTRNETQLYYAESLMTSMGAEYMWNTANVETFIDMSWDEQHKDVFLEQWSWVVDTAKTPASYMLEREISNVWNRVVYDGVNVRTALEDSQVIVNKEITRKMIEFGFIDSAGNVLKPYVLPTRETIESWLT